MNKQLRTLTFALVLLTATLFAQTPTNEPKRTPAQKWFEDAKFGLFVHWGVYALKGKGEWVMNNDRIPISEYEKLPPQFNPTEFNAKEWVSLVKEAGMKYITITSKHHDGFCLFDSKLSDYNVVKATPFKRDVLKELADECHRQGIKLFFYYSQLDWHHPDYFPRGGTGKFAGRPDSGDWQKYKDYYIGQVRELCTNYGEIGGLWFDGWWDRPNADWGHDELYGMIHQLRPNALVGNNHHRAPFPGEDFQMFEQDLPGVNTAGFNTTLISPLPLETCLTMNNSWGYNANDKGFKSVPQLVHTLVGAAGRGANLLLNVGPMPNGKIQPEFQERLRAMGAWLRENGDSVYGTQRGPYNPSGWGVSTLKGQRVFLHVFNFQPTLELPTPKNEIVSVKLFKTKQSVRFTRSEDTLTLHLPESVRDPMDTIVVMELKGKITAIAPAPQKLAADKPNALKAISAQTVGSLRYESEKDKDCIGYWTNAKDYVAWRVRSPQAATYTVELTYACDKGSGGSEFAVMVGNQKVSGKIQETGSWTNFVIVPLGQLQVPAGDVEIVVKPIFKPGLAVMNLRQVVLKP
jgi:alpha-L-fucosidase